MTRIIKLLLLCNHPATRAGRLMFFYNHNSFCDASPRAVRRPYPTYVHNKPVQAMVLCEFRQNLSAQKHAVSGRLLARLISLLIHPADFAKGSSGAAQQRVAGCRPCWLLQRHGFQGQSFAEAASAINSSYTSPYTVAASLAATCWPTSRRRHR